MSESEKWAKPLVDCRYPKGADRIKVNKKTLLNDLVSAHSAGAMNVCETLLSSHIHNPYQTVDELIGDLQIKIKENWNTFYKYNPKNNAPLIIEDVIKMKPLPMEYLLGDSL